LKLAGIPIPRVIVTADDVRHGKPNPEPYLTAAERLRVNPEKCLVIEDAPAGIRAAHAGGMKVVGLTSTYEASKLTEADAVVGKLAQVRVSVDGIPNLVVNIG
jgi:mannitol-1-/sugar-/sorbitol-6-phosphatase